MMSTEVNTDFEKLEQLAESYKGIPWELDKREVKKVFNFATVLDINFYAEGFGEHKKGSEGDLSYPDGLFMWQQIVDYNRKLVPRHVILFDVDQNYSWFQKEREQYPWRTNMRRMEYEPSVVYNLSDKIFWNQFQGEKQGDLIIQKLFELEKSALQPDIKHPVHAEPYHIGKMMLDAFRLEAPLFTKHDRVNRTFTKYSF